MLNAVNVFAMNNKVVYRNSELNNRTVSVDAISGSEFWSIEGSNVQFTWFNVPANKRFEKHSHDSEQITYVLEGALYFKSGNAAYKLSKGDCILIPANTEHEVWTEKESAKAVDAWSPINENFSRKSNLLNK